MSRALTHRGNTNIKAQEIAMKTLQGHLAALFPIATLVRAVGCGGNSTSRPGVMVTIAPPSVPTLNIGASQRFTATVSGADNKTVIWSVQEEAARTWLVPEAPPTAANFTPAAAGTFHIVATSFADPNASGTATVTVPPPSIAVTPGAAICLPAGAVQQFVAEVTGAASDGVVWSVLEHDGGGIDQGGLYTAPDREGTYHIVAASSADPDLTAVATVAVGQPS
jgi:hypothetical protein